MFAWQSKNGSGGFDHFVKDCNTLDEAKKCIIEHLEKNNSEYAQIVDTELVKCLKLCKSLNNSENTRSWERVYDMGSTKFIDESFWHNEGGCDCLCAQ